ncbi:MAG TPA: hypothetical protein VGQ26_19590 [Streptosporangiaceae bacterium]|jgi:hypothetical protein|nr:hypothetical protein [Streptosporangiaceae bacterium]
MFGANGGVPAPARLRTPPKASLGPQYTVIYTVPGVTPQPGQQFGRIRQNVYPHAVGGPVIYTPPGQRGFGQPLQAAGWLRGSPQLARTLAQLGVPPGVQAVLQTHLPVAAHPVAAHQSGPPTHGWLIGSAAAVAAAVLAGTALWLRHRRPATVRDSESRTGGPA